MLRGPMSTAMSPGSPSPAAPLTLEALTARPLVLAGPTASGKSGLALALAERTGGAIVCADSRQVYRGMRIGTAGPTDAELAAVPHHLFHTRAPTDRLDAAQWALEARATCAALMDAGTWPILVGGTGLYLRALRLGLADAPPKDPAVRAALEDRLHTEGLPALFAALQEVDPERAARVGASDAVRIVRALEIVQLTGKPASAQRTWRLDAPPLFDAHWLLLWPQSDWLAKRLKRRAKAMFDDGLVPEATALRAQYGADDALVHTMGYAEALALDDGTMTAEEALAATVKRQRAYAKRQRTWFKKEPWFARLDPAGLTSEDALVAAALNALGAAG